MKSFTFRTALLALLAQLLILAPALAAAPVATVVAARGNILALAVDGQSRKLAVRSPVYAEDTLKTDARSRAQIMFTDNTLISLGQATTMKIAEYRWQPENKDGALKTRISEGAFRVMGGALAHSAPQNFKTETPTATIGIRGSMYAGVVTADSLSVVFQGGKGIEISNALGSVTITTPGYGTTAASGNPPLPAVKFSAAELGELDKALNAGGTGDREETSGGEKTGQESGPAASGQDSGDTAENQQPPADSAGGSSQADNDQTPTVGVSPDANNAAPDAQVASISDQLNTVTTDNSQNTIATDVIDTALPSTPTGKTVAVLSGNHSSFLRDIDLTQADPTHYSSTFLNYQSGPVTANLLDNGQLSGTLSGGVTFGPYPISGYSPAPTGYSGYSTSNSTITYNEPTLGPLNLISTTYADLSGQFFYNTIDKTIDSTTDYLLGQLIYAGIPSTTIPSGGIDLFTGQVLHYNTSGTSFDANLEPFTLEISYYNDRIIGRVSDTAAVNGNHNGAIFFGTVNPDGTATVNVIASGTPPPNAPPAVVGVLPAGTPEISSTQGTAAVTLYGNANQGLGFTASGGDYSIFDNTQSSTWEAIGAALRQTTSKIIDNYPTAPLTYTGFVVGVADDTSTGAASRIFMNSQASDFSMSANPTTGVLTGTITAAELTNGGIANLTGLTVGGSAATSAYINTEDMVAILSGSNLGVTSYGSILYNNGPMGEKISSTPNSYLTWGYWEIGYTDPVDGSLDHLFSSQSFFVTGLQTDPAFISGIMNTAFTGTYTGKAYGVELDPAGQNATPLTNGATNLTVNFQNPSAANAITGSISFDQATLSISSTAGALTSNGFNAFVSSVSGATPTTSAVNGAFYGPSAEAVGGNFNARISSGETYLGVFGGSR